MACGLRAAMPRASSSAAFRGSGSVLVARPSATASSPLTTRPEKVSSLATSRPTSSGSSWLPVMSGIRPHLISSTDSRASGATMRMSAPSAICRPPPSALPVTAAMTGTGSSAQTYAARCPAARAGPSWTGGRSTCRLSRSPSRIAWNAPKSRPAQKSGPSPDSTTARTPGSDLSRSPVVIRPANIALSSALRFSGRFSRTSATPSVIVTVTRCSVIVSPSSGPERKASLRVIREEAGVDTTATARDTAAREAASRMAAAADAWLGSLDPAQRAVASGAAPSADAGSDAERRRWFYTPTDHGGLTLGDQRPAQQRLAHQLVASGLSVAGYNTVATIVGLDNVLDQVEGWRVDWGRERGRDPGMYYLRVFGQPGGAAPWGWRFGGHHVSLNNLVVDGAVQSTTPCFFGADPAVSPLLGPIPLRPLAGAEDLARELVRSLDPDRAGRAVLLDRAPSDIVGGNRSELSDGDQMIHLRDIWRGQFADPGLLDLVTRMGDGAERASGYDAADHQRVALSLSPRGLPAAGLDAGQRDLLRALLATYLGRVPDGLAPALDDAALDAVHLAWAGPTGLGEPHYYRLQGPRLLIEYDNTQRHANHAHSVWRDPAADFGYDVLGAHLAAHHL